MLLQYYQEDPLLFVILGITAFSLIIILFYYWYFFSRLAWAKENNEAKKDSSGKALSVVIAAKNEFNNLKENLPYILYQDHPDFEVVVVDDHSTDDTTYLIKEYQKEHKNLHIVSIGENKNFFRGKKFPLALGIKSAHNPYIVLTDADCKPLSDQWLRQIESGFSIKKEVVIAYGGYEQRKGFLNMLIRYETMQTAMQYLSFARAGIAYMGVGRNLAYTKEIFFKNNGFSSHYHLPSGDDDLFINSVCKKRNFSVSLHKDSFTYSKPQERFSDWIRQKRRHLTSGKHYKFSHKFLLSLLPLTKLFFWVGLILLFSLNYQPIILAGLTFFYLISHFLIFKKCMLRLNEKNLLLISPLLELYFLVFTPLLMFYNLFVREIRWK